MKDDYYTIEEIADRFKVTRTSVYNWMHRGLLEFVIIGNKRRVTGTAIDAFIKSGSDAVMTEEKEAQ